MGLITLIGAIGVFGCGGAERDVALWRFRSIGRKDWGARLDLKLGELTRSCWVLTLSFFPRKGRYRVDAAILAVGVQCCLSLTIH